MTEAKPTWRTAMNGLACAITDCDPMASGWISLCGKFITGPDSKTAHRCPDCVRKTEAKRTLEQSIATLDYIAQSPTADPGGFHPATVRIAQDALTHLRELESLRNAVFALCGHLPGVSQEEQLAAVRAEIEELRAALDHERGQPS